MKKLLAIALAFCAGFAAHADDGDEGGVEASRKGAAAKAELKKLLKEGVKTEENGDVVITGLPPVTTMNIDRVREVGYVFFRLLIYVDPDLDVEKLGESIDKAAGNRRTPGGGMYIKDIMSGIDKYFARRNLNLQKINFSGTAPRQKIDDGLPILCWISSNGDYEGHYVNRLEKRGEAKDMASWSKELRKLEKKNKKGNSYMKALCIGYNKATGEYLFNGLAKEDIWMTEKEAKDAMLEAYVLRF